MYALIGLVAGVVGEATGLVWLWLKWRAAERETAVANVVTNATVEALHTAYEDLAVARAALVRANDLETKADAKTVENSPDLASAVGRVNRL